MDRDNRWERVELAYDALVNGKGVEATSAAEAIEASYAEEVTDEFVKPTVIMEDGKPVPRKADLRAFVLCGKEVKVWASGLTRFSRQADSFVVNSSQGGGFKDTWVLCQ